MAPYASRDGAQDASWQPPPGGFCGPVSKEPTKAHSGSELSSEIHAGERRVIDTTGEEKRVTERKHDRTNRLLALSSAAVLTVYGAGYIRTRAAAEKFSDGPPLRRPLAPQVTTGMPRTDTPEPALRRATPSSESARATLAAALAAGATAAHVTKSSAAVVAAEPIEKVRPAKLAPAEEFTANVEKSSVADRASDPSSTVSAAFPPLVAMTPAASPLTLTGQVSQLSTVPPAPKWKDGTYSGWGTCRHGDIEATVTVAAGRITSARVSQCLTRYSCSLIDPIIPEVVVRQSPEVDYVSGATQSTNAFYYAVIEALAKAKP
jgi:uncharacterized protein with FMN-binding domain